MGGEELERELKSARQRVAELERLLEASERTQPAIANSETVIRAIIEGMSQSLFLKDRNSVYIFVNEAYAHSLGLEPEDFVGKDDFSFYPPALAEKYRADDREVMVSGERRVFEETFVAGGREHLAQTDKAPVTNEAGEVIAVLGVFENITERKKAERQLLEKELFLGRITDLAYKADTEGIVTYVNPAAEKIIGLKTEEIIGKPFLPLFVEADRQSLMDVYERTLQGESLVNTLTFLNGVICHFSSLPLRNDAGEIVGTFGIARDMTEVVKAKQSLADSERRYLALVSQSPIAYEVYDANGLQLLVNAAYEKMWGMRAEDSVGKFNVRTDPQVETLGLSSFVERAYAGESVKLPEFEWDPTKSGFPGRARWLSTRIYPLKDESNEVTNIVITHEDVTERKRAEQAQKESEERFRSLFDNVNEAVALHRIITNEDGKPVDFVFLDCNPMYEALTRLKRDEIVGKRGLEVLPNLEQKWIDAYGRVAQTREPTSFVDHSEYLDRFWEVKVYSPKEDHFAVAMSDVTERVRAEQNLLVNNRRWLEAQRVGNIGNWEYDIERDQIWGSEQAFRIHGIPFDAETNPDQILPLEAVEKRLVERERGHQALVDLITEDRPYELEFELAPDHDSPARIIYSKAELERDASGRPIKVVGTVQDITARKQDEQERARLEAQLQQAMKMEAVGRLAGGVAHDFNNLLTGIIGNVDFMLMGMTPGDPLAEDILDVRKAAESAATLTRQLLTFSRKQIIEPKVVDLNKVVSNLHKMLTRLIGEHIDLKIIPAACPATVRVDEGQLEQGLVNLSLNARDAMPDGGQLVVETSQVTLDENSRNHPTMKPGDYIVLTVRDTGHGMSQEETTRIFEPFFTTKPKGRGTGLGLASIYGFVEQAGGSIAVTSEMGMGTTFRVYLPRVVQPPEKANPVSRPPDVSRGKETILLVEDEALVRRVANRILDRLGYNVLTACDGPDAIKLAEDYSGRIDLLMTDVVMPQMNGRQLAQELTRTRPAMKVLYTSGYTEDVIGHHGVVDESLNFIVKPYALQALALKLREILEDGEG
jgi:PAS domain S-box-containing protein